MRNERSRTKLVSPSEHTSPWQILVALLDTGRPGAEIESNAISKESISVTG